MNSSDSSQNYSPPVRCPQCGERQNRFTGRIGNDDNGFEKIDCMVCGRVFSDKEYQELLFQAHAEAIPPIKAQA